ncbi:uncharacterized protein [Nicotiana tomentosiformis]|uniref:uncharacterized protein n=1 Tax=Nicotiana tomentosiformis TaxID=4098 RepID=UPI00388CD8E8
MDIQVLKFARYLDMSRSFLDIPVHVSISVGDSIVVDHLYLSCEVTIGGYDTMANVLADALSRKPMGSLRHVGADKLEMTKDLYILANLSVRLPDVGDAGVIVKNATESSLVAEIKTGQFDDPALICWWNDMRRNIAEYVAQFSNCHQVKSKNQKLGGLLQNIEIL